MRCFKCGELMEARTLKNGRISDTCPKCGRRVVRPEKGGTDHDKDQTCGQGIHHTEAEVVGGKPVTEASGNPFAFATEARREEASSEESKESVIP